MPGRVFSIFLSLTAAALLAGGVRASAQDTRTDTVRVAETMTSEMRLKAKVDSLKGALAEVPPHNLKLPVSKLLPDADSLRMGYGARPATDSTRVDSRGYMSLMVKVRSLRDSLALYSSQLDSVSTERLRSRLESVSEELRDIERAFLSGGAVPSQEEDEGLLLPGDTGSKSIESLVD